LGAVRSTVQGAGTIPVLYDASLHCAAFKPVDKWGLGNCVEGLVARREKRKDFKKKKCKNGIFFGR
jgi:hypothetical protein